jgi:hypothetical protein
VKHRGNEGERKRKGTEKEDENLALVTKKSFLY